MKILFDIGCNTGQNSLDTTKNNPDIICFAFEPDPNLYNYLLQASSSFKDRYNVFNVAVSNFDGKSKFFISGYDQCSSLLTFSPDIKEKWPDFDTDNFKRIQEIEVDVITLKTFIESHKISKIDYFHCDTQGSDLCVLQGLGEYISIVKEGCIEVAAYKDILYLDQNTFQDSVLYLLYHNFMITSASPNDMYKHELNVFFKNKANI